MFGLIWSEPPCMCWGKGVMTARCRIWSLQLGDSASCRQPAIERCCLMGRKTECNRVWLYRSFSLLLFAALWLYRFRGQRVSRLQVPDLACNPSTADGVWLVVTSLSCWGDGSQSPVVQCRGTPMSAKARLISKLHTSSFFSSNVTFKPARANNPAPTSPPTPPPITTTRGRSAKTAILRCSQREPARVLFQTDVCIVQSMNCTSGYLLFVYTCDLAWEVLMVSFMEDSSILVRYAKWHECWSGVDSR